MAITATSVSLDGRSRPWLLGSSTPNNGSAGTLDPYNAAHCDGSAAGGSAAQNASYLYGKSHASAGEQNPSTLTVAAGNIVFLQYVSGTVATQGSGAGNSTPAGSPSTGLTPLPAGGDDNDNMATNVVKGLRAANHTGTVNTSGTTVTWVSGDKFSNDMLGTPISPGVIWINNVAFTISSFTGTTAGGAITMTIATSAGTQTGVTYLTWGAKTSIGGVVGAFTDGSGNVVTGGTFDFAGWGGIVPNNAMTLTSVSAGTAGITLYNGSGLPTPAAAVGNLVTIAGFTNPLNNGTFFVFAVSSSNWSVWNPNYVPESHAATMTPFTGIVLRVPAGATKLSLGIADTDLHDNTGSYTLQATVMDKTSLYEWNGSIPPFMRFPSFGITSPSAIYDHTSGLTASPWMTPRASFQDPNSPLAKPFTGQIFPRGAQGTGGNAAGVGQNFPY
jgi:hypothetical protein